VFEGIDLRRSTAGIEGSDPAEGTDVRLCVFCVLCKQWPLRRAHQVFRDVLPGVCVRVGVGGSNLRDQETSKEATWAHF
jgi:hypothetical protein